MSNLIPSQTKDTFSKPETSSQTKPSITISISTSSPRLSLSDTDNPFVITLTANLNYHRFITAHSWDNVLCAVPTHGKGLDDFLDFISLTPLHDDVFASDPLTKKIEVEDAVEERYPLKLCWGSYEYFNHLDPRAPSIFSLKLGPWRLDPKLPNPPRPKDKDGRWIWDTPIIPLEAKWDWGVIEDLEEGVDYEIRLKEGTFVKWWKEGSRDDHLELYATHSNWFLACLLGRVFQPWKRSPVLDESEWIPLVVEGEMPRVTVVA